MGIITKEVEIRPNGKMIQYYRDKGYDAKYNIPLIVKVEDLQKKSSVSVDVLCDYCGKIKNIKYSSYTKSISSIGKYACNECSYRKMSEVMLDKYGVDNYAKTDECQKKMKSTCEYKYGENYRQLFMKKAFNTFKEKTGYDYPSQSPEVREKIENSFLKHYGVKNPGQSKKIREKVANSYYCNSSQKSSNQQRYICNLYQGILNFAIKYYSADIYLPEDNIVCEFDGSGHFLNIKTGRETLSEHNQKEIIRNNIIKREGYKQMRIISTTDKLPSDIILLQLLSHSKEYFSNYPNHSWIEFNIDTSTVRNAEQIDGVFFDFGELRKIKKSNLPEDTTTLDETA